MSGTKLGRLRDISIGFIAGIGLTITSIGGLSGRFQANTHNGAEAGRVISQGSAPLEGLQEGLPVPNLKEAPRAHKLQEIDLPSGPI